MGFFLKHSETGRLNGLVILGHGRTNDPSSSSLILLKLTCLPLVEVVQDFTAEVLLPLPLALTRVVEEVPQGPVLPLQQLPVQQQGERRLCGPEKGTWVKRITAKHQDNSL